MREEWYGNNYFRKNYKYLEVSMQLKINNEKKELKFHGSYEFPVFVSHEVLSDYERGAFAWHWHPEVELTYIEEGQIEYQVNDTVYCLKAGEGLFCNANALHTGHMLNQGDCRYLSVTFHPRMIYGFEGSAGDKKYVEPVTRNDLLGGLHLVPDTEWQKQILLLIQTIVTDYEGHLPGFELVICQTLLQIWNTLYTNVWSEISPDPSAQYKDIERLRKTITYLQEHYHEHVTLGAIAENVNICASECCRFFKRHMNQTIFEYLLEYRIEKSLPLLIKGEDSITSIAQMVGFSNPAYFGKVFHQVMRCSPSDYRKSFISKTQKV